MDKSQDISDMIERVDVAEDRCGVRLEAISASICDGKVSVHGEIHSVDNDETPPIELVMGVYDDKGRVVKINRIDVDGNKLGFSLFSSGYFFWMPSSVKPAKIRIYPKLDY